MILKRYLEGFDSEKGGYIGAFALLQRAPEVSATKIKQDLRM